MTITLSSQYLRHRHLKIHFPLTLYNKFAKTKSKWFDWKVTGAWKFKNRFKLFGDQPRHEIKNGSKILGEQPRH